MTLVARKPPATPQKRGKRGGRSRWGRVAGTVAWPVRTVARWVVLWPARATGLAVAVAATTPVTLREVTGVVVGGCAVLAGMSGSPGGDPSLHITAKYRQRRNRIRRRWVTLMADCGLARPAAYGGPDKRRPRLRRISPEPLGVRVLVDGAPVAAGVDHFANVADKLRAGLKAHHVHIEPAGQLVAIHLRYEQPTHFGPKPIRYRELAQDGRPLHVTVGLDEDRRPVVRDLRLPHLLIGAPGSGKSSETWVILAALLHARIPFRLRVFDPKGGQEFTALEHAAWEYERRPYAWPGFLEHAHRTLSAKQAALRARNQAELIAFTAAMPLDIMLVDELLTALAFGRGAGRKVKVGGATISAEDAFMLYLSTCRAAGATVLAGSQLAQKEEIGPVRDLLPNVTVLRVAPTARSVVDMALGSGASKVYEAHRLSPDRRYAGIGFMAGEHGEVVKYRSALLTVGERASVVRGVAAMTRTLRAAGGDEVEP